MNTIELDCAPGGIRPGDLIEGVLAETGLPVFEAGSKLFGNWTWSFGPEHDEVFAKAKPIIKGRITSLYHDGLIRYGSW
jgi:hypothetical protein